MWISVSNLYAAVTLSTDEERAWLAEYLAFDDVAARFRKARHNAGDGKVHLYNAFGNSFPTGLLPLVQSAAGDAGHKVELIDKRVDPTTAAAVAACAGATDGWLRDYQLEAVDAVIAKKRGIIWAPTGSGKGDVAVALVRRIPCRWLFVVHRTQLVDDIAARYERRTRLRAGRVAEGTYQEAEDDLEGLTCATLQTLHKGLVKRDPRTLRLLEQTQGVMCDEAHVSPAATFRQVLMGTPNAFYRVGLSGTPLARGDRRSLLAVAALGPVIYRIKTEQLVSEGILAKPRIEMIEVKNNGVHAPTYQGVYGECIARGAARNRALVQATKAAEKPALVFVKELRHGREMTRMLERAGMSAEFVSGTAPIDARKRAVRDLESGRLEVVVCSLPYSELLLVRGAQSGISLRKIGEIVERELQRESLEVWTRLATGVDGWAQITGGVKHPRNGVQIVETGLRGGARAMTTSNHALIEADNSASTPEVGKVYQQTLTAPTTATPQTCIDVCARLHDAGVSHEFEVRIGGLTQVRMRELKTELKVLRGEQCGDPRTTLRALKRTHAYGGRGREALSEFFACVAYHKGLYRMPLPITSEEAWFITALGLQAKVEKKWSRSRYSLPLSLAVSPALAAVAGMFVGEGCTVEAGKGRGTHAPIRAAVLAAKADLPIDTREGFADKLKIRETYKVELLAALGWKATETPTQLRLIGSVPFALMRHVLRVGGKAAEKRVPDFVWNSNADVREAFLFGYFLGDGHKTPRGVQWATVSRQLAVGTYYLLLSLGKNASLDHSKGLQQQIAQSAKMQNVPVSRHRRYSVQSYGSLFGYKDPASRAHHRRLPANAATTVRVQHEHDQDEFVYDVCVAGVERFYAGAGVLAHNTVIFQEGVDIPDLRTVVIASGGASVIAALQRIGRGMRVAAGKDTFHVIDVKDVGCGCRGVLHSGCKWLEKHARARMGSYSKEGHQVLVVQPSLLPQRAVAEEEELQAAQTLGSSDDVATLAEMLEEKS